MKPIADFFKGLFDSRLWPARWHCGYWSDFHGWLYIISDLMIWIAYFLIPVIIFNYVSRRKQVIKYSGIYLLFAAFILLCGSTHFLDASMFWLPMYRLNALVRFLTAVVSLLTVYYLIKILPEAFKQKTSVELELEIERRELAELKLSEANRDLAAFASIASHDLQEPLRKIKTFSSLLYEANDGNFSLESRDLTEKIVHSAERMQGLVNDVLSLSVLGEIIMPAPVDVKQVIANALEDLEIKIKEKAASIHVGDIPPVLGNPNYLTQLFLNLISNAIKFNKQKPLITVTGEQLGSRVIIHIKDNGIGIGETDLIRIFEPFTRLNAKSEFEGSGIGLTICRKIVAIHKGTIRVDSKPNEGTIFTIDLPAANG